MVDWERVARSAMHARQIAILDALDIDGGRTLSTVELSRELDVPLNGLAYHVRRLAAMEVVELVRTRRVRGAVQHFYRLVARS